MMTLQQMQSEVTRFSTGRGSPIAITFRVESYDWVFVSQSCRLVLTMSIVDPISNSPTTATNYNSVPDVARRDVESFRSWVTLRVKWLWLHECKEFLFLDDKLATDPHPEQPWYAHSRALRERSSATPPPDVRKLFAAAGMTKRRTPGYVSRLPKPTHRD